MTIHLHRASRTDQLAEGLGELLATPLADPFATDVVVVPTHGVERWLSQRLADRLGICAGVDFRTPWSLFSTLRGGDDPWASDAILWPLLEAIDDSLGEDWAAPLARHLGEDRAGEERELRRGRRYATARRLSRLFGAYATQRPTLIEAWAAGDSEDGLGAPLADDLAWQPPLWRALALRIDADPPHVHQRELIARLGSDPEGVDLPDRLSLFGHTRLSLPDAELLRALGAHRDVHLWLPHPSAAMWTGLAGLAGATVRGDDDSAERVGHPLMASLSRDVRELQRTLSGLADTDEVAPDPVAPDSVLGWLQADLRADQVGPRRVLVESDRSVQIHACHSPARQVEVLRESILGLMAGDPTLQPRDIVVMCPDVEAYAPLISASFAVQGHHPAGQLRVSLADRAIDQVNPLLSVLSRLLEFVDGRAGADHVLDFAGLEVVRRRFGWNDDALSSVSRWVSDAGIRWGFDSEHRAEYGLGGIISNTWDFGLDRLALGAVMSSHEAAGIDRTLPLDDVGSGDVEIAGRVMEFMARLRRAVRDLRAAVTAAQWRTGLQDAVESLAYASEPWQTAHLRRCLQERFSDGATGLGLADVRTLLADAFEGRPTRSSFRTGGITVCTMVPMRSVPHRVVCLIGLDDGVFPRIGIGDGDDVLARNPVTGERDIRSEDRQLFLDAILAATDALVVTYTGADINSGQVRPPAVPVGELMDALDLTAVASDGRGAAEALTIRQPLQTFDPRNLVPGALVPGNVFSFDPLALAAASAADARRVPRPRPGDHILPLEEGDVTVADLVDFWASPVRGYFRQRLDVGLPRDDDPIKASMPVAPSHLELWGVGQRLLDDMLRGIHPETAKQREWRRGVLPPGRLGWRQLTTILGDVRDIAVEVLQLRQLPARSVDIDIDLGGGRRLRGVVPHVYGDRIIAAGYGRLRAKQRMESWVRLLALTVNDVDRSWSAVTVARASQGPGLEISHLRPVDESAVTALQVLVDLRDQGLRAPLPIPLKSSFAYANTRRRGSAQAALAKAGFQWKDRPGYGERDDFPGEQSAPEQVAAWGAGADLPGSEAPLPTDPYADEPTRFGALSRAIWTPLLDDEVGRL